MSLTDSQRMQTLLFDLPDEERGRVVHFYELLAAENLKQNLTRLISPEDFKSGHLVDVLELLKTGWIDYPVVDLGSGCGVPGLLAAVIAPGDWTLVESEKRKADFLQRAVDELSLHAQVQVRAERLEGYLKNHTTHSIVARAVGTVEKIYSWISKCSTWNTLILLKGPSWDEEWNQFENSRYRGKLRILGIHSYHIAESGRERKIIKLIRSDRR